MSAYGAAIRVWHMTYWTARLRAGKLRWRPEKISAGEWFTLRTYSPDQGEYS